MNFSVSWHRMTFASAMRTFGSLTAQFSQKLNFFVFGVNCLTACIVCSVCFAEIIIGEYFSPLFSYRTETDPCHPDTRPLRHRGFTRAPSQPAQVQPSPPERKPRLFNKRIILWGAGKMLSECHRGEVGSMGSTR